MKYAEERLSITLPVRFSEPIYKLVKDQAWTDRKYYGEWVRQAVIEALVHRGAPVPEEITHTKGLNIPRRGNGIV